MTPCELAVLLHYYISQTEHPRYTAMAVQEGICKFLNNGIFQRTDKDTVVSVTDKGKAFITMILSTPYPKAAWVDERTGAVVSA